MRWMAIAATTLTCVAFLGCGVTAAQTETETTSETPQGLTPECVKRDTACASYNGAMVDIECHANEGRDLIQACKPLDTTIDGKATHVFCCRDANGG